MGGPTLLAMVGKTPDGSGFGCRSFTPSFIAPPRPLVGHNCFCRAAFAPFHPALLLALCSSLLVLTISESARRASQIWMTIASCPH